MERISNNVTPLSLASVALIREVNVKEEHPPLQPPSPERSLTQAEKLPVSLPLVRTYQEQLLKEGYCVIENVYSRELINILNRQMGNVLEEVMQKVQGRPRPFPISGDLIERAQGRLDFVYGVNEGIFREPEFYNPPIIEELMSLMLKEDYYHFCGALPTEPYGHAGDWHRDVYTLFDDATDIKLPPWYFTVVVPLQDLTLEMGPTEVKPATHHMLWDRGLKEVEPYAPLLKAGSVLIMEARIIHRGLANQTDQFRHCLYHIYSKKWYRELDEAEETILGETPSYWLK